MQKTKEQLAAEWKKHQQEVAQCDCIPEERKAYIAARMSFAEDFSDGAFMAYMEESGIDVSELEIFSTTHYAETHAKGAKR